MKSEKEVCELIERFTTDDVTRPQLRKPWIFGGDVYATDGRIAIRLKNVYGLDYEHVKDDDRRASYAERIDKWVLEECECIGIGSDKVERVALQMPLLRKAALAAMDDARRFAVKEYPETTDDIEQMTVNEAVDLYSVVILPGTKRHVIAAKYAAMICDVADAFGPVEFFVPGGGFKRGDYGRYRIWCPGAKFDILLMCIRSDKMDTRGLSIADCATATLVHDISDDSFVDFSRLQFPEKRGARWKTKAG